MILTKCTFLGLNVCRRVSGTISARFGVKRTNSHAASPVYVQPHEVAPLDTLGTRSRAIFSNSLEFLTKQPLSKRDRLPPFASIILYKPSL